MKLRRTGATIAAGLLTGAAALGFGLGAAQADPVDWTAGAATTFTLSIPDEDTGDVITLDLAMTDGTFTGVVDDEAGTITGDIVHGENSHDVSLGDGLDATITGQLTIADIDVSWDADAGDDGTDEEGQEGEGDEGADITEETAEPVDVAGTASVVFDLNAIAVPLISPDVIPTAPCTITLPAQISGSYDAAGGELTIGAAEMQLSPESISGECGGFREIVEPLFGSATGAFESVVSGEPIEPNQPEPQPEPQPDPPANNGATPIPTKPSYTG